MNTNNGSSTNTNNNNNNKSLRLSTNEDQQHHHHQQDTVLITGGTGFIGSHTLLELLKHGFRCVILDNLDNSSLQVLERIKQISSTSVKDVTNKLIFVQVDLVDLTTTKQAVQDYAPYVGCIHFAGFKAVGESVAIPLHYYYNNVVGTMNLLSALDAVGCYTLVFSSSCTVYGTSQNMPLVETEPTGATNPYGQTKCQIEQILCDVGQAPNSKWKIALLRYFNPVGAHPSGLIGEDPQGVPNNLLPFVAQVASGLREKVNVFGNDYPTPDGTGVRDYIHVMDVAEAHVCALRKVMSNLKPGSVEAYNLGTGKGSSVLDVIKAFEKASGKSIPYSIAPRRTGDAACAYCDPTKAKNELGFQAHRTMEDACVDAWRWQQQNPFGYRKDPSVGVGQQQQQQQQQDQNPNQRKALVFHIFHQ
jgi:UDP-glucose 4-epimerase